MVKKRYWLVGGMPGCTNRADLQISNIITLVTMIVMLL